MGQSHFEVAFKFLSQNWLLLAAQSHKIFQSLTDRILVNKYLTVLLRFIGDLKNTLVTL